ncbi:helix-turn-helix domain-containing protein [Methylobacterium sp. E-025]|uniref:helix-turn-helix domain-containing protein n=1 Tax=Methylobacterium sp. E-025 TaxID=2836561 RepID=UPI001FBA4DAF|nr:helix-turn-helix domain-containing protein [Methylobacterium sp. E-025]MCJ2111213.1 helix-turn-helix domain-containing protein [Methylobacterium sp. E-025]
MKGRSIPAKPSDLDKLVDETAARVADATIAALRSMFSESFIRGVIEREAKIAVQAAFLAEAERVRVEVPAQPTTGLRAIDLTPLAYRPKKVCEILGISMALFHKLVTDGKLGARKIGSATVVRKEDLDAYLAGLPPTMTAAKAPEVRSR